MYFLKFLSNIVEKSLKRCIIMPSNSVQDGDLNLQEMKTKSPACPLGGYHMYVIRSKVASHCLIISKNDVQAAKVFKI